MVLVHAFLDVCSVDLCGTLVFQAVEGRKQTGEGEREERGVLSWAGLEDLDLLPYISVEGFR